METYSVKQIADMLGTNPETVRRWIRDKKLNSVQVSRKDGNVVTEDELQRFLKASPKYMPRFSASVTAGLAAAPAVGITLLLGTLLGGKVAGYVDEKKRLEVRIRPEDIESFINEELVRHKESLKAKEAAKQQLEDEIFSEKQQIEQLAYLLTHTELLTMAEDKNEKE